jgi:hypothetical protein
MICPIVFIKRNIANKNTVICGHKKHPFQCCHYIQGCSGCQPIWNLTRCPLLHIASLASRHGPRGARGDAPFEIRPYRYCAFNVFTFLARPSKLSDKTRNFPRRSTLFCFCLTPLYYNHIIISCYDSCVLWFLGGQVPIRSIQISELNRRRHEIQA